MSLRPVLDRFATLSTTSPLMLPRRRKFRIMRARRYTPRTATRRPRRITFDMPIIRTKIIATLGPASDDVETLRQLFDAGVDVCRLNFSHGTLEQHAATLANVRVAAGQHGQPIAVLGDLGGPKIRLGEIRDVDGSGGMPINVGEELVIQRRATVGENRRVSSTYENLVDDVSVGDRVLIEDGMLRFICTDKRRDEIKLQNTAGGVLKTAKG